MQGCHNGGGDNDTHALYWELFFRDVPLLAATHTGTGSCLVLLCVAQVGNKTDLVDKR